MVVETCALVKAVFVGLSALLQEQQLILPLKFCKVLELSLTEHVSQGWLCMSSKDHRKHISLLMVAISKGQQHLEGQETHSRILLSLQGKTAGPNQTIMQGDVVLLLWHEIGQQAQVRPMRNFIENSHVELHLS